MQDQRSYTCVRVNHALNMFCDTLKHSQLYRIISNILQYKAGCYFFTNALPQLSKSSDPHLQWLYIYWYRSRFYFTQRGVCIGWFSSSFSSPLYFFPFNTSHKLLHSIEKNHPRQRLSWKHFSPQGEFLKIMSIWLQYWNLNWDTFDQVSFLQ